MQNSPLPVNIPDLIITSLHYLYTSLTTTLLCLFSYAPTYLSITLYISALKYLCPRPRADNLYRTLRTLLYTLSVFFHFTFLRIFALPFEGKDHLVAPSFAWACAWTVALGLVGSTTVFVVAVLIFKPLQLLGWWTTTEAAQPWIYESSKGKDGDKEPTVRFEVKDGGVVGGACECVSDEAVVTVESLCKDVPAGETVGIYRAGTEGKENDDFVWFIHMFGTGGGSGVRAGEKEK